MSEEDDHETRDAVLISFTVDSDAFIDGSFPTRGYVIDQASFSLAMGSLTVGMPDPYPVGLVPYFLLRNDDPAVDGFFLSHGPEYPTGLAMDVPGGLDPYFYVDHQVGYSGDTSDSLDILDALGSDGYTGLTSFYCTVSDGPFEPIGWIITAMTMTSSVATESTTWGGVKALFR